MPSWLDRQRACARCGGRARTSPRHEAQLFVADEDRALYHAAASMASNYVVTLLGAAERLAGTQESIAHCCGATRAGGDRETGPLMALRARSRSYRARRRGRHQASACGRSDARPRVLAVGTRWLPRRRRWPRAGGANDASDADRAHRARRSRCRAGAAANGKTSAWFRRWGALHEGHLSLLRRAGWTAVYVVISVFVNRRNSTILRISRRTPGMRPPMRRWHVRSVWIFLCPEPLPCTGGIRHDRRRGSAERAARRRGARARPFPRRWTVVTKLFNIRARVAYFGQKDAQQALIIRQMVRDLDQPLRMKSVRPYARQMVWRCRVGTSARAQRFVFGRSVTARARRGRAFDRSRGSVEGP